MPTQKPGLGIRLLVVIGVVVAAAAGLVLLARYWLAERRQKRG